MPMLRVWPPRFLQVPALRAEVPPSPKTIARSAAPPVSVIYGKLLRENAMRTAIPIPTKQLAGAGRSRNFCRGFPPDSDLDLLVRFAPDADWSLLDHVAMEEELSAIVGRKVDLVSQRAIERSSNWIRAEDHPGERGTVVGDGTDAGKGRHHFQNADGRRIRPFSRPCAVLSLRTSRSGSTFSAPSPAVTPARTATTTCWWWCRMMRLHAA